MQQTQTQSRKRLAPGTSPHRLQNASNLQHSYATFPDIPDISQLSDDQFIAIGQPGFNSSTIHILPDGKRNGTTLQDNAGEMAKLSTQLVRRNNNQQITTRGRAPTPTIQDVWSDPLGGIHPLEPYEDDGHLERRAMTARKNAQSKRPPKQIPPFIQKLSSFLDAGNTNLITWSADGNSFVVLDEDEFAKKLIPELFKHNNYASFVRQLNMYGFHKKVGLSDNSMRASEKKAKTPSEYSNAYFKRGRPQLLWLIQKPEKETFTTKKKAKSKTKESDQDSGDDSKRNVESLVENGVPAAGSTDLVTIGSQEYASVKREIGELQRSQKHITSMLARLRDENNEYIRQASSMVAQHERHETSINAILTFLATFYNRSLADNGSFASMFANAIPNTQSQGNVVDVGDYDDSSVSQPNQDMAPRQTRRPLALLPAPSPSSLGTVSGNETLRPSPAPRRHSSHSNTSRKATLSTELCNGRGSNNQSSARSSPAPSIKDSSFTNAQAVHDNSHIMTVIHNVNANNANTPSNSKAEPGPLFDFNSALQHYETANGNAPLTPEQRDNMLALMATTSGSSTPIGKATKFLATDSTNSFPSDYMSHINANQQRLEHLQRMQEEQSIKMQNLAERLQPLSPSGSIPGLALPGNPYQNDQYRDTQFDVPMGDLDMISYLDSDYFPEFDGDIGDIGVNLASNNDINFGEALGRQGHDRPGTFTGSGDNVSDDGSLFGDLAEDASRTGDGNGNDYLSGPAGYGGGGKIVGSVGTSSGMHTPAPPKMDDEMSETNMMQSPMKKKRIVK